VHAGGRFTPLTISTPFAAAAGRGDDPADIGVKEALDSAGRFII